MPPAHSSTPVTRRVTRAFGAGAFAALYFICIPALHARPTTYSASHPRIAKTSGADRALLRISSCRGKGYTLSVRVIMQRIHAVGRKKRREQPVWSVGTPADRKGEARHQARALLRPRRSTVVSILRVRRSARPARRISSFQTLSLPPDLNFTYSATSSG